MKTRSLVLVTAWLSCSTVGAAAQAPRASPRRRDFWIAGGLTLAVTIPLDTRIRDFALKHETHTLDRFASPIGRFGSPQYILPATAAAIVIPRLLHDPATSTAVADIGVGYVVASATDFVVKSLVGRHRPDSTGNSLRFSPLQGTHEWHSFPSGHVMGAMALATAISLKANRPWVAWTTYSLASVVGLQRIYKDEHWTSDVIAGTLLGITTSASTIRWRERHRVGIAP